MTDMDRALPSGRAVVNGAASVSAVPASVPSAMSDEALAEAMLPGDPRGKAVVARMKPQSRALYEHMLWVADELNAGRVPPGVMI